jgi:hypothetical protein
VLATTSGDYAFERARRISNMLVIRLASRAFLRSRNNAENPIMRTLAKLLILVGLGAALTGCVVAPYGPRAYVAPGVVVVHPGYYGPHYYYGPR